MEDLFERVRKLRSSLVLSLSQVKLIPCEEEELRY